MIIKLEIEAGESGNAKFRMKEKWKIFRIPLEKSESRDMLRTRCSAPEGDEAIEIQRIAKSGVPWKIE